MLHQALIKLHQALGYKPSDGLCHGFCVCWLESYFIGNGEYFERIMHHIVDTHTDVLLQSIQEAKIKKEALISEDNDLLEIFSFFYKLELFHRPSLNSIFNAPSVISQNSIDVISKFASSPEIQDLGGLHTLHSYPLILNKNEIKDYLEKLRQLFNAPNEQNDTPIGLLLETETHAVALIYKPGEDSWLFRDINQKFVKWRKEDIAKKVHQGLLLGINKSAYVAFNAKVMLPFMDNRRALITESLTSFMTQYRINANFCERQANFINLAYIAASHGHAPELEILAKNKTDLNKASSYGVTPAFIAAQNSHVAALEILAEYRADLNITANDERTPACIAAEEGNVAALEVLAKYKADLNKSANDAYTPAFVAACKGHVAALKVLAENNANLNQTYNDSATPAYFVTQNGNVTALKVLIEYKADLNLATKGGVSPAFIAAEQGDAIALEILAKHKADLNQARNDGITPVLMAAHNGHAAALKILAKYKADLNIAAKDGETPACLAAQNGHVVALKVLAEHKADLNKATNEGFTPVFIAAQMGRLLVVETLITLGVDFQIPYRATSIKLIKFASTKSDEVNQRMRIFLDRGIEEQVAVTPYDIAVLMGHSEIAALINKNVDIDKQQESVSSKSDAPKVSAIYASFYNQVHSPTMAPVENIMHPRIGSTN